MAGSIGSKMFQVLVRSQTVNQGKPIIPSITTHSKRPLLALGKIESFEMKTCPNQVGEN
jgi:hypothetical protein